LFVTKIYNIKSIKKFLKKYKSTLLLIIFLLITSFILLITNSKFQTTLANKLADEINIEFGTEIAINKAMEAIADNKKRILLTLATGTGKTLSPIGLSSEYKVIFVCAARHVGLALAKSAISIGKKIAFAFGCDSVDDIRLHYFAAKDYVKHNATGRDIKYRDGSRKVDNSVGDNIEIMITDIKSYLCAMHYMIAFNKRDQHKLITYWDEPTITMDKADDDNHRYIHDNFDP
jgi:hypothetical protein